MPLGGALEWVGDDSARLGVFGEAWALEDLTRRGFRLIEWRWKHPLGEIDLVGLDHGVLVFVEVKTRRYRPGYRAAEAVHFDKRKKLVLLGRAYLRRFVRRHRPQGVRFDVVGVSIRREDAAPGVEVEYIRGAFDEDAECL